MTRQIDFAYKHRLKPTGGNNPYTFEVYDAAMYTGNIPTITGFTAKLAFNDRKDRFFEDGVITYGDGNTISFDTAEAGIVDLREGDMDRGMIMWKITGGTGFFEGVTGHITSNFLDFEDGTSADHHFGVVFLPE
ncbi:MAG: hypothetical protein QNK37_19215 [Acidobacteriota bacterium]|nr:hypothetical protein [Acidobacteriota bacterium]